MACPLDSARLAAGLAPDLKCAGAVHRGTVRANRDSKPGRFASGSLLGSRWCEPMRACGPMSAQEIRGDCRADQNEGVGPCIAGVDPSPAPLRWAPATLSPVPWSSAATTRAAQCGDPPAAATPRPVLVDAERIRHGGWAPPWSCGIPRKPSPFCRRPCSVRSLAQRGRGVANIRRGMHPRSCGGGCDTTAAKLPLAPLAEAPAAPCLPMPIGPPVRGWVRRRTLAHESRGSRLPGRRHVHASPRMDRELEGGLQPRRGAMLSRTVERCVRGATVASPAVSCTLAGQAIASSAALEWSVARRPARGLRSMLRPIATGGAGNLLRGRLPGGRRQQVRTRDIPATRGVALELACGSLLPAEEPRGGRDTQAGGAARALLRGPSGVVLHTGGGAEWRACQNARGSRTEAGSPRAACPLCKKYCGFRQGARGVSR